MKTTEKYRVIKKGTGEQILENGTINYFGFVIIRIKYFFNLFYNDNKYYVSGDDIDQTCLLYNIIYYSSYYKNADDAIKYLNIAIENYFEKLKSENVISYKETIL